MSQTTGTWIAATPFAGSVLERRRVERAVTERLLTENPVGATAGTVLRVVLASAGELRRCGLVEGFEPALHAMARARLSERADQRVAAGV